MSVGNNVAVNMMASVSTVHNAGGMIARSESATSIKPFRPEIIAGKNVEQSPLMQSAIQEPDAASNNEIVAQRLKALSSIYNNVEGVIGRSKVVSPSVVFREDTVLDSTGTRIQAPQIAVRALEATVRAQLLDQKKNRDSQV